MRTKPYIAVFLVWVALSLFFTVGSGYAQVQEAQEKFDSGMEFYEKKMYDQAIKEFTQAIERKSDFAKAHHQRGLAYQSLGKLEKAIADYTAAISLGLCEAEIYYNRGIAYYYNDSLDKAIEDWSQAIEVDPDQPQVYQKRAYAYMLKNQYHKSWDDVRKLRALGYEPDAKFLDELKRVSGRSE
ncbi:MAG: hypothetical protein AMJ95_03875 [Omnitrophica WOR_2 bacterium SM23_72]|nr:MAG: hypothetical protein AMJ95_03875 [Omnitrophica WOR_2 bacterium SM23_72]